MREPKKSETLEIRLPYGSKQAFMDRCRAEGRSASETMRAFIDGYVQPPAPPRRWNTSWRWIAAALSALAVGAIAAPSLARPSCLAGLNAWTATAPEGLLHTGPLHGR